MALTQLLALSLSLCNIQVNSSGQVTVLNETLLTGFLSDLSHQQYVVPASNAASGLLLAWNNKSGMEQSDQLYWGISWYKVAMCSSNVGYIERNNGRLGQMKNEGT